MASGYTLALHTKLYQMLWINPERQILLLMMELYERLYRDRLLLLTASSHKSLQDGILIGCFLKDCYHSNI